MLSQALTDDRRHRCKCAASKLWSVSRFKSDLSRSFDVFSGQEQGRRGLQSETNIIDWSVIGNRKLMNQVMFARALASIICTMKICHRLMVAMPKRRWL